MGTKDHTWPERILRSLFIIEFSSFWVSRSFDLGDLGILEKSPVNIFNYYIFEISLFHWSKCTIECAIRLTLILKSAQARCGRRSDPQTMMWNHCSNLFYFKFVSEKIYLIWKKVWRQWFCTKLMENFVDNSLYVCIHFSQIYFLESKRIRHLYNGHVLNGAKLQDSTSCWVGIQPFFSKSCWMECQNQSHSLSRCVRKFLLLKISRG